MVPEPNWFVRLADQFSIAIDQLVDETILPRLDLALNRGLWRQPSNEPMIDCFEIGPEQAFDFADLAGMQFDFATYSYFLSAHTTDPEATSCTFRENLDVMPPG